MEHTSNYNLSQWAGEDRILREDFNADNAKIEAALAQEAAARAAADTNLQNTINAAISALETNGLKLKTGTFTGNGTKSRTFELGVKPKLLILWTSGSGSSSTSVTGAILTEFACAQFLSSGSAYMKTPGDPCALTASGFTVTAANANLGLNANGSTLSYWVLY